MGRGTTQSTTNTDTTRPGVMAPRGSATATAGMRSCRMVRAGGGGSNSGCGRVKSDLRVGANMLRFYTDDAPRMKISLTMVLVMSLYFIGFVTALHMFGKLYHSRSIGV